jgi:hypothetical protein
MAAIWSLVAQGLAYLDFSQPAPENWELHLTDSGAAALADAGLNPDNAEAFLAQLAQRVPTTSPTVLLYLREALATYAHRCYLASAVMLGVASEAAFLDMAEAFCTWLPPTPQARYRTILDDPRAQYIHKFREFRSRLEPLRGQLPPELSDNLALTFDSVLDLLRIYRNEAGHPTGKQYRRDDAFINLQMFARYLEKLYALKAFFEASSAAP